MKPFFSSFLAVATSFFILDRSLVSAETFTGTSARFDQRFVRQGSFLFAAVRMHMVPVT
jgi:hypothetical protein